jgi:hypothetical protein
MDAQPMPKSVVTLLCTLSRLRITHQRKTPSHCHRSKRAHQAISCPSVLVRENVRNAMHQNPTCSRISPNPYSSSAAGLKFQCNGILQSELLKRALFQKRITDTLKANLMASFKKQPLYFD